MGLLPYIQLAEAVEPEGHKLGADLGLCQFLAGNLGFQFLFCGFQFFQTAFRGLGQDTLLDGVQEVLNGRVCFPQLLFIEGQVDILSVLQVHEHRHDGFNGGIVHHHLHGFVYHQIFNPFLADRLLVALGTLLFHRHALVVVVNIPCVAGAALAAEVGPAVAAEQLGCQQIIVLGLVAGRGLLVLRQLLLHPVKEVLGDDGGNSVRHHNVPVGVLPDIAAVVQKVLYAVVGHLLAPCVLHALPVEPVPDLGHGGPLVIPLERLTDKGGGERVKLEALVAVDLIADGQGAAVVLGFQGVLRHAPDYLFGQVGGVVFGVALQHAFQNDTLGPVGNDLGGGHHLDPVLFQSGLVAGAVVAVAGKPVQLPDDDHIKQAFAAVLNHVLKFRAVVRLGGKGPVYVVAQDGDTVLLGKGGTLSNLALNAFLPLVVGGIAGIYHSFHWSPSIMRSRVSFSFSFMGDWGSKHISIKRRISSRSGAAFGLNSYVTPWGLSVRAKI